MTRLLITTDAWRPQINGVVRTLEAIAAELPALGVTPIFLTPADFHAVPYPTDPTLTFALAHPAAINRHFRAADPDFVHISTEGPIGWAVRRHCLRNGMGFTTSYHTRFPEYLSARFRLPQRWTYRALRHFHNAGNGCMVSTSTMERELAELGFTDLLRWSRGVDADLFRPRPGIDVLNLPRPIFLTVGRLAVEKNLEVFLDLDLPGSKVVVGDGPQRAELREAYPDVHFTGPQSGEALAEIYASADVFVFPSRTDTFGLVLLEALASGLPIAAHPVAGPIDVLGSSGTGVLDEDLGKAAVAAVDIPHHLCREFGLRFSWRASAAQFLDNITAAHPTRRAA